MVRGQDSWLVPCVHSAMESACVLSSASGHRGRLVVAAVATAGFFSVALGESTYAGDRDVRYMNCVVPCEFECLHNDMPLHQLVKHGEVRKAREESGAQGHPYDLLPRGKKRYQDKLHGALTRARQDLLANGQMMYPDHNPQGADVDLPWVLRWLNWDCAENCRYECMIKNSELRRLSGEQQVHYFGKWPFTRVLGTQELLSWVFSLLNGLPYLLFLLRDAWLAPFTQARCSTVWTLRCYCLLHVNTWVQSALFHARESTMTEALDYSCANMAVAAALGFAFYAHCPARWSWTTAVVVSYSLPVVAWSSVVFYILLMHFDYGLFMTLTVAMGIVVSLTWLAWAWRFRLHYPFYWKVLIASWGPYLVLPLELLDFPPQFGGLLDAHALWHILTVPIQFVFVDFAKDLLRHEAAIETAAVEKNL